MSVVKCYSVDIYNIVGPLLMEAKSHLENARDKMENLKLPSKLGCNSEKRILTDLLDAKYVRVNNLHKEVIKIAFDFERAEGINHQYLNNKLKNEEYLEINELNLLFSNGGGPDSKEINEPVIEENSDEEVTFDMFFENYMKEENHGKLILIGDEKLGFEYAVAQTPGAFMTAIKYLDKKHAKEGWHYGKGLLYDFHPTDKEKKLNFNKTLNNPNKATCCATFVSEALYLSGFIIEDNLTFGKVFNPNYQVYLDKIMKNLGYEKITSLDELQEGDIILINYDPDVDDKANHIEVFAGRDPKTGELLIYSAGEDKSLQFLGAEKIKNLNLYLYGDWWAYRLPDISKNE